MKFKITILVALLTIYNFAYAEYKPLAYCKNAKVDLVDLRKGESDGYSKDSLKTNLFIDTKSKKVFVENSGGKTELIYISDSQGGTMHFIEKAPLGAIILYSLHDNILTIQKSYNLLGKPIMVNSYLTCTSY